MPWLKVANLEQLTFDSLEEAVERYTVTAERLDRAGKTRLAAEAHSAAQTAAEEIDRRHTYKAAYGIN